MNSLELKIIVKLKNHHRGKDRAITYKQLAWLLGIEPRHLRSLVSEIIKSGQAPICSTSDSGYFFPENEDEFNHAQNEDLSRIKELAKKHRGRRRAWTTYKEQYREVKQLVML
jgi:hypothetical protein